MIPIQHSRFQGFGALGARCEDSILRRTATSRNPTVSHRLFESWVQPCCHSPGWVRPHIGQAPNPAKKSLESTLATLATRVVTGKGKHWPPKPQFDASRPVTPKADRRFVLCRPLCHFTTNCPASRPMKPIDAAAFRAAHSQTSPRPMAIRA